MRLKPSKRFFTITLAALAAALLAFYTLREIFGPFAPEVIDKNFFSVFVVALLGVFIWNRRIIAEEKRAEAAGADSPGADSTPVEGDRATGAEAERRDAAE